MSWLGPFLGHLHPVVVHFPIALLVVLLLMEAWNAWVRPLQLASIRGFLLALGTLSAFVAVLFGVLLAESEVYGGEAISWHRWAGITTALLAGGCYLTWLRARQESEDGNRAYKAMLTVTVIGVIATGHFGGQLTHGADYLTRSLPWNANQDALSADAFRSIKESGELSEEQQRALNQSVRAIFAHTCYRCHSSDKIEGELRLDEREHVFAGGESGPVIIPGDAAGSELYQRITLPIDHEDKMPNEGKALQPNEIEQIQLWIDQGAYWPEGIDIEVFREAPLAPRSPPLPVLAGIDHPVDRLVGAYFDSLNVDWPDVVDERLFMRRAYLDAIGLLPTPDQVTAYLADNSPNKREQLVETLLAQDHEYAQHWLTFWNDLLRNDYSGTGYITGGRRQITDWLYTSLVSNKPYDVMVRELINPVEGAEGFIQGIQWRGTFNSSQGTEMQAAQNVAQSLLGLNLKCASCHDSFVNNFKLEDAYAFASVFADSSLEIHRCDVPSGRFAEAGFVYEELGAIDGTLPKDERLAMLAEIMVTPDNGRLRRTLVNRLWKQLMGRGFVEPVDEMDRLPWDQDALDWLSSNFAENGHDIREMLALIMTSRTYQLASTSVEDPEELKDELYAFAGPLVRRLTAEQFTDAVSNALAPMYHAVAYDPFDSRGEIQARWIWYPDIKQSQNAYAGSRYLRKTFEARRAIESASLLITVDESYELFINGESIAEGRDWRRPDLYDVTQHLNVGENVLAVLGHNTGEVPNPAGLLLSLQLNYMNGTTDRIESNRTWKSTDTLEEGWELPNFDDADWQNAQQKNDRDWGQVLAFYHEAPQEQLPFARASLVKTDPFLKALGRETRDNVITSRPPQATLLQALELTNGTFLFEALEDGAKAWHTEWGEDPETLIEQGYQVLLGRAPTRKEARTASRSLGDQPDVDAVHDFLWALVLLPEFQLIL